MKLKAVLDDRRTQLVDLRQHLEKESGDNGILEAVVQHRSSKNEFSDKRLAELEREFCEILENDRIVAVRIAGLESDVGVFTDEYRRIQEKTSVVSSQSTRAEAALEERERAFALGLREGERLSSELQETRRKFDDLQSKGEKAHEKASRAKSLASDAAGDLKALEEQVTLLRSDVDVKESDMSAVAFEAAATERQADEVRFRYMSSRDVPL